MRRALVTSVLGAPGLGAVRELGRAGWGVAGADWRRAPLGLHSRYSSPYAVVPRPADPLHGPALLGCCREARADVLLPLGTATTGAITAMRAHFDGAVAVAVPPAEAFAAAFDKRRTMEDCAMLGIPVPRSDTAGPWVVKPARDLGGAEGVVYCDTPAAVEAAREACRARWGDPLVQEYVPGDARAMRGVVLLFDRASRLVARFTLRKVRTRPARGGLTALAVSTDEPALVEQMMPLFEHWRWQGAAEVELKIDPRDGRAKVIEVNPRFPGYLPFAARCGLPLARLAALAALGEAPPSPPPYAAGVRYVNRGLWLKSVAGDLLRGPGRCDAWRRARAELREGVPPAPLQERADPLPRLGKILQECRQTLLGPSA